MTENIAKPIRALATAALLLIPAAGIVHAQSGYTISTYAGTASTSGFAGDGGAPSAAQLAGPISIVLDSSGNLYIADENNNRIRKISGGNINTVAGNGFKNYLGDGAAATNAELNTPNAVAVDKSGNIYIADSLNFVIRKVNTSGTISTVAGNINASAPANGGFSGDNGPAIDAQLSIIAGVAVDAAGNIYIADTKNNRIRKVLASNGNITSLAGSQTAGAGGDNGPSTLASLNAPTGLTLDAAGNLYIADTGNNKIRRISTTGVITTVAGNQFGLQGFSGDGGPATGAMLNQPQGVAVDSAGNLFIADRTNSRIRMVSAAGIITTIAGNGRFNYTGDGGPATSAALNFPDDVAVDAKGNIYVADYQNQVIRLLTPSSPTTGGGAPAINSGGVVSAAAFGGFPSIAPGTWIEIYGTNLAADTREWGSADFNGSNAPTVLDRTSVTIANQAAFVRYVSSGQVNVQVPSNAVTGQQQIIVSTATGNSAAYNVNINGVQPGLLAPASFVVGGKQYIAATFTDGATFVLPPNTIPGVPSRQAKPGETIVMYGIGFGPVGGVQAGQIAPASSAVATAPQILFGSSLATLGYAGLAPGIVGLYQFNVVVPNVAANDLVPVTFSVGGVQGQQTLFTAVGK